MNSSNYGESWDSAVGVVTRRRAARPSSRGLIRGREKRSSKGKAKQSLYKAKGFQGVEALRFQDIQHMKALRLSVLRTGHLYPLLEYSCSSFLITVTSSGIQPATFWLEAQCPPLQAGTIWYYRA